MDHTFYLADVFTDRPFGGNQLAVLPDARGLSADRMQALAREFNFSETAFVLPPRTRGHTRHVRIFTPTTELPFAGHPTVGTAAVLAATEPGLGPRLLLEEGVGVVTVDVAGTHARLTLTAPYERPGHSPATAAVAGALSLTGDDVVDCWYGGVGRRFCYARLRDAAAVDRAALDRAAWSAGLAGGWAADLYVFAGDFRPGGRVYARAFVPGAGIEEDPATGSACAGLVASLPGTADGEHTLLVEQGVKMGRASRIEATSVTAGGVLSSVSVGGHTVIVASGTITVPDA
ncbi:PhzF family phenazine biosynthesis protein [Streptomyces specialis]|uniref:PhzF family phenazine biosynthesis protein n=1 Tax=Streptomyces specialis TaxID=498367 RepID=UPI00073EB015|nr:PhzF family phenazine biosynthesis protein [Streptomyces specialis]